MICAPVSIHDTSKACIRLQCLDPSTKQEAGVLEVNRGKDGESMEAHEYKYKETLIVTA